MTRHGITPDGKDISRDRAIKDLIDGSPWPYLIETMIYVFISVGSIGFIIWLVELCE